MERLSGITCEIKDGDNTYTGKVRFDETMYNYPAFIASDGYCSGYEYALLDEDNNTIIYVHLAYPDYEELSEYKDYLKKNKEAYDTGDGDTLDRFTIYVHSMFFHYFVLSSSFATKIPQLLCIVK